MGNDWIIQYWARILAAILMIKMATGLVRDAEKLVTANVKSRHPEMADDIEAHLNGKSHFDEVNQTYTGPTRAAKDLEVGMVLNDANTPRVILAIKDSEEHPGNLEVELPGDIRYTYNPDDIIAVTDIPEVQS